MFRRTSMPFSAAYPWLILLALLVAGWLLRRRQAGLSLSTRQKIGLGLGAFCGAMIGAKLPFAFADPAGPWTGTAWLSHGKTILSGIVGGYLGVELAKWALDIRVKTGGSFAVPVAVAVAIGRLACFCAGCCYGTATSLPWGVSFPTALERPGVDRHPTQLYESLFHAVAAVVLWQLERRGIWKGQLIKAYILAYLVYRLATEIIRPEARLWLGATAYQWAALVLIPLFLWLWRRDARRFSEAQELAV